MVYVHGGLESHIPLNILLNASPEPYRSTSFHSSFIQKRRTKKLKPLKLAQEIRFACKTFKNSHVLAKPLKPSEFIPNKPILARPRVQRITGQGKKPSFNTLQPPATLPSFPSGFFGQETSDNLGGCWYDSYLPVGRVLQTQQSPVGPAGRIVGNIKYLKKKNQPMGFSYILFFIKISMDLFVGFPCIFFMTSSKYGFSSLFSSPAIASIPRCHD